MNSPLGERLQSVRKKQAQYDNDTANMCSTWGVGGDEDLTVRASVLKPVEDSRHGCAERGSARGSTQEPYWPRRMKAGREVGHPLLGPRVLVAEDDHLTKANSNHTRRNKTDRDETELQIESKMGKETQRNNNKKATLDNNTWKR